MHEVSLVHALWDEVDRHAADHPGAVVVLVRVRLGETRRTEDHVVVAREHGGALEACADDLAPARGLYPAR